MFRMPARVSPLIVSLLACLSVLPRCDEIAAQDHQANVTVDPAAFQAMEFRSVGPTRGGRSTAVTGYRDRLHTFLMGTVGGGI
jgi:hypothetical protein